ncbi:MAG: 30S ribosomal protein S20 [Proteobacteria bacterium]|nr:30S ribosomal protein S20 [Pseudomonadota bacterium]
MANHASARKRIRRNVRRAVINGARVSNARTQIKRVEAAIAAGDSKKAEEAFKKVQPVLARAAVKGTLDKKAVSRKMSRLSARIKALKKSA